MARTRRPRTRRHYAYLLRCADGSYYAGYTVDPVRRLSAHRDGRASRYTRGRGPHRLVAVWRCPTHHAALVLERVLKRLSHAAKHRLASGQPITAVVERARDLGVIGARPGASVRTLCATIEWLSP